MSVFQDIKELTGTRYHRAEHNGDVLDDYYLRAAKKKGVRLPTGNDNKDPEYINYLGAHVETPTAGLSEHVVYLDLASLYPSNMLMLNVSPETLIGTQEDFEQSEYTEEEVVWGYVDTRDVKWLEEGETYSDFTDNADSGSATHCRSTDAKRQEGEYKMVYDPNASSSKVKWTTDEPQYERCYFIHPDVQEGIVTSLVADLVELKYQYEGSMYEAVKRIVNSVYGTVSEATQHKCARLYDWRMAESITLSGRKIIQYTRDKAIELLQERGYDNAYAAVGDTDGMGISLPSAESWEDCMEDVVAVVDEINEVHYPQWLTETFGVDYSTEHQEVETESYARRLFVPSSDPSDPTATGSKKRYAQYMQLEDCETEEADVVINGTPFEIVDEVNATGVEAIRSDTSDATTEVQLWVLEQLVKRGEAAQNDIFEVLAAVDDVAHNGKVAPSWLAQRGGLSKDPSEYGSKKRRASPIYRGAKWANKHLDAEISDDKPQKYAVDSVGNYPSTYDTDTAEDGDVVDWISLPQSMDVPDDISIDYETMADKSIRQPLTPIIETMGWSWGEVESRTIDTSLEAFM